MRAPTLFQLQVCHSVAGALVGKYEGLPFIHVTVFRVPERQAPGQAAPVQMLPPRGYKW